MSWTAKKNGMGLLAVAILASLASVAIALAAFPRDSAEVIARDAVTPGEPAGRELGQLSNDQAPSSLPLAEPADSTSPEAPLSADPSDGEQSDDDQGDGEQAAVATASADPAEAEEDTPQAESASDADPATPAASSTAPPSPASSSPAPTTTGPSTTAPTAAGPTTTGPTTTVPSAAVTTPPTTAPAPSNAVARAGTTRSTTTTTIPPTTTTAAPTTTTTAPAPQPAGSRGAASFIASSAPTNIPVYDTAWQMLVRSTPSQADQYFAALRANGFSGTWTGIIHHAPATYNSNFAGGGQVGRLENGEVVLNPAYIDHVRSILDAAERHGMRVGLVAAWQNLYLPGGDADAGIASSDQVRGTITTANSYAYGRQIAAAFGDHPAVSMWVFGGDAGTNNTNANKAVWREMARGVRDAGNQLSITYHTPTSEFDQLNYAGEPWLDFISPETGHIQDAATTEQELRTVAGAYGLPVWQGEARYFNINFDWVDAAFRNPGVAEVRADAQAAKNAGVSGYVYGDAGRWTWCSGAGDSTPCNANNIAASFGAGEQAVIEVFTG